MVSHARSTTMVKSLPPPLPGQQTLGMFGVTATWTHRSAKVTVNVDDIERPDGEGVQSVACAFCDKTFPSKFARDQHVRRSVSCAELSQKQAETMSVSLEKEQQVAMKTALAVEIVSHNCNTSRFPASRVL